MARKSTKDAPLDPMEEMRKRFEIAETAVSNKYQDCIDDIRFAFEPGQQWDESMSAKRGKRPTYEFNKTRPAVKAVTNDMRQNNPSVKVRAAEDSHRKLADIMMGLIRNIEANSRAEIAYDTAGFYSASGGFGAYRIATQYSNDSAFDQDIVIKEVRNPFSIKFDPSAKEFDKRDGRFCFVEDAITREEFKHRFPDKELVDFSSGANSYGDWFNEKTIRIAEYWRKEYKKKTIYQLSDGRVLDEDDYLAVEPSLGAAPIDPMTGQPTGEAVTLRTSRVVEYDCIKVSIVSGKEELTDVTEWAGKFIPIIPVWGESVNIEGNELFQGICRPIKDAQRIFNWNVCTGLEILANQPRSPILATPAMMENHETEWQNMATNNAPALTYNVDPMAPNGGAPIRLNPPNFPNAMFEGAQFASDLIKSVSNVVDAPIQARASSGKAIMAVEHQQDVGNFDYVDNLARAKSFGAEILIDLIPRIYDTERQIMILGEDGRESYETLNQTVQSPDGQWHVINDLSQGKYAVTVTVGPNFATQRMETLDLLMNMAQNQNLAPVVADLIAKNSDMAGAEELEHRLRKIAIKGGIIDPTERDGPPPEPPPPDPNIAADAQLKASQSMLAQANAQKAMAEAQAIHQPQAVDNSLEMMKMQYDAQCEQQKAAVDAEKLRLEAENLRIEGFRAETERMAAITAANTPPEAPEKSEKDDSGATALSLLVSESLARTLANIDQMGDGFQKITQAANVMAEAANANTEAAAASAEAAQLSAIANAPKQRQGVMTRQPDGSYLVQVSEQ